LKLSVTEYEREQLAVARQIVNELNANLAGRGAEFRFAVTLASNDAYFMPDLNDILATAGDEP
jgi:hypothetical protein